MLSDLTEWNPTRCHPFAVVRTTDGVIHLAEWSIGGSSVTPDVLTLCGVPHTEFGLTHDSENICAECRSEQTEEKAHVVLHLGLIRGSGMGWRINLADGSGIEIKILARTANVNFRDSHTARSMRELCLKYGRVGSRMVDGQTLWGVLIADHELVYQEDGGQPVEIPQAITSFEYIAFFDA